MKIKKEFLDYFRMEILPDIRREERQYKKENQIDYLIRYCAWRDLVGNLVAKKQLPERALDWSNPYNTD